MEKKYELAVVGYESSVLIYRAVGANIFPVSEDAEAQEKVATLFNETAVGGENSRYAVIFVEENFYAALPDDLMEKFAKKALPAIVPVPSPEETDKDFSGARLSKIVERAIGSDILG